MVARPTANSMKTVSPATTFRTTTVPVVELATLNSAPMPAAVQVIGQCHLLLLYATLARFACTGWYPSHSNLKRHQEANAAHHTTVLGRAWLNDRPLLRRLFLKPQWV